MRPPPRRWAPARLQTHAVFQAYRTCAKVLLSNVQMPVYSAPATLVIVDFFSGSQAFCSFLDFAKCRDFRVVYVPIDNHATRLPDDFPHPTYDWDIPDHLRNNPH
jgi:hypothetical protein